MTQPLAVHPRCLSPAPDVDSAERKRMVAVDGARQEAARADAGRRAAIYGDIDSLMSRRHFKHEGKDVLVAKADSSRSQRQVEQDVVGRSSNAAKNRGKKHVKTQDSARLRQILSPPSTSEQPTVTTRSSGILPDTSNSFDASKFVRHRSRHYFDETVRASRYAELIGRAEQQPDLAALPEGGLEPVEGAAPLSVRRVISALLPSPRNPNVAREARRRYAAEVESKVQCLLASSGNTRFSPWQPDETEERAVCSPQPWELSPAVAEGSSGAGQGRPDGGPCEPVSEVPSPPRAGPLPTLLTSRPAWERLGLGFGDKEKTCKIPLGPGLPQDA